MADIGNAGLIDRPAESGASLEENRLTMDESRFYFDGLETVWRDSGSGPGPESDLWTKVISPAAGSTLLPADAVVIEVSPSSAIIKVSVGFANGDTELIHDGSNFTANYSSSIRSLTIDNTFMYTIQRTGGWHSAPSLTAYITQ